MQKDQQLNTRKILPRASLRQRVAAAGVFLAVVIFFGVFALAAGGRIELDRWVDPCGFEQKYGLPCPTCGITTSVLAFSQGKFFKSVYIQPAGALLCCVLVVIAFFALLVVIFGVYFPFLKRFVTEVKVKHIILALIVIIVAGWLVTLARALATSRQG
jgi:hypothetical protein